MITSLIEIYGMRFVPYEKASVSKAATCVRRSHSILIPKIGPRECMITKAAVSQFSEEAVNNAIALNTKGGRKRHRDSLTLIGSETL